MTTPWSALPPGTDPDVQFRRLTAAREEFLTSGTLTQALRPMVADSWRRCQAQWLGRPSDGPPVELTDDDLDSYRGQHPLAAIMPLVRQLLVADATEAGLIVAVADAAGRLLWVDGAARLRSRAEGMNFIEGALWSEDAAGTNAPGTALTVGHPVQIFTAEHLSAHITPWSCAAAPIRDPRTGQLLGALDLTGGDQAAAPHAFTLVRAVAATIEAELRLRHRQEHCEPPTLPRQRHRGPSYIAVRHGVRIRMWGTEESIRQTLVQWAAEDHDGR